MLGPSFEVTVFDMMGIFQREGKEGRGKERKKRRERRGEEEGNGAKEEGKIKGEKWDRRKEEEREGGIKVNLWLRPKTSKGSYCITSTSSMLTTRGRMQSQKTWTTHNTCLPSLLSPPISLLRLRMNNNGGIAVVLLFNLPSLLSSFPSFPAFSSLIVDWLRRVCCCLPFNLPFFLS